MKTWQTLALVGLLTAGQAEALGDIDAQRGEQVWQMRCSGCHSLDENRVGPRHRGVWGRVAGSVEGFRYSSAVRALGVTWNDDTLDRWLADPEAMAPGQRMGYQITDAGERRLLIAYLRTLKTP